MKGGWQPRQSDGHSWEKLNQENIQKKRDNQDQKTHSTKKKKESQQEKTNKQKRQGKLSQADLFLTMMQQFRRILEGTCSASKEQ